MTKARIERSLHLTISKYFQKHSLFLIQGTLLSITKVRITPDLDLARISISFLSLENMQEATKMLQNILIEHHWSIKKYVATQLRYRLRKVPAELRFYVDDRPSIASHTIQLIDKLTS